MKIDEKYPYQMKLSIWLRVWVSRQLARFWNSQSNWEFQRGLATPKVSLIMPNKADPNPAAKGTIFYTKGLDLYMLLFGAKNVFRRGLKTLNQSESLFLRRTGMGLRETLNQIESFNFGRDE